MKAYNALDVKISKTGINTVVNPRLGIYMRIFFLGRGGGNFSIRSAETESLWNFNTARAMRTGRQLFDFQCFGISGKYG